MASEKERCSRCGNVRKLTAFAPNQMTTLWLCAACIAADKKRRSEAALGKAGRKPKSPSQLEDQQWKAFLNSVDSRKLETILVTEGYSGTRGQMLKQLLTAITRAGSVSKARATAAE